MGMVHSTLSPKLTMIAAYLCQFPMGMVHQAKIKDLSLALGKGVNSLWVWFTMFCNKATKFAEVATMCQFPMGMVHFWSLTHGYSIS